MASKKGKLRAALRSESAKKPKLRAKYVPEHQPREPAARQRCQAWSTTFPALLWREKGELSNHLHEQGILVDFSGQAYPAGKKGVCVRSLEFAGESVAPPMKARSVQQAHLPSARSPRFQRRT